MTVKEVSKSAQQGYVQSYAVPLPVKDLPQWVEKRMPSIRQLLAFNDYHRAVPKTGLVIDGLYNGGKKAPDSVLMNRFVDDFLTNPTPRKEELALSYCPLPKQYLDFAIANLPEELQDVDNDTKARFILLLMAIIHQESAFDPNKDSSARAIGLAQITTDTAAYIMGEEIGFNELLDPAINIKIAERILYEGLSLRHRDAFCLEDNDDLKVAAVRYNGGRGRTLRYLRTAENGQLSTAKISIGETRNYTELVIAKYELYTALYLDEVAERLQQESMFGSGNSSDILLEYGHYILP
ncbi:MAG: lytic transglycosylase domain-containing protein [Candidatus Margulisbacteria bacterium]|nr:lytic transglycosylase domain-containing protein [Candidatus Margulisiibacteriota bacterium]MBU1022551.1 lytic transglycosylase domain-containing protein [Candidatus Margulisiibacteriota bacterium]MBU1728837.1 lytic transglycosylase domain-containing protein [Candidatus Margulisiibacteriota bacterium]MBU1955468.1 lytic transglycosylase domain-containing protein [Candidatus Margulisiibacteriota bacterium]